MNVYHGSNLVVSSPDVAHSQRRLDFGNGFYVTGVRMQAERWARRKAFWYEDGVPVVSIFRYDEDANLRILDFGNDMGAWLDFVCECRAGGNAYLGYDIIKGKVANDKVFRVVDMYRRGDWPKDRAIAEMKAYDGYDQMAFITQKAIDCSLTFEGSCEVES